MPKVYLSITGSKQGPFPGEAVRDYHAGRWISASRIALDPSQPRDVASGQTSGKRQHAPVKFVKALGAASPQLFRAAATKEVLSVRLQFVRPTSAASDHVYRTVQLTGVVVRTVKRTASPTSATMEYEEVMFTFETIAIDGKDGKPTTNDDWLS
jgi:type VI secretion system secreted protein Hcp